MEEVLGAETVQNIIASSFEWPGFLDDDNKIFEYKGVLLPVNLCQAEELQALETWKARKEDIFVVSYPKAGTTWTQEVVSAIANNGDLEKVNKSHTMFRVPFIEATLFHTPEAPPMHEIVDKMKSPRTIKSHLPGTLLPPDVFQKKARIVYVARNPKDLCVSFYYFHIIDPPLPTPKSWNAFFDDFYAGKVSYGPWWEHYLFYWNLRHEPNVLFIKFEDMKRDLKAVVQRTAKFLGYTFADDVIDSIVDHCSFASMKKNPMTNPDTIWKQAREHVEKNMKQENTAKDTAKGRKEERISFMRKGKVGDWRNHFTVAQNEAFEAFVQEKLAGSGLTFNY